MQDFNEADDNRLAINGGRLARASKPVLSVRLKDDTLAEEVFIAVKLVLAKQKRSEILSEVDFIDNMDGRGKQCCICHICTHLEHVKRNLIVFFCQFFLSNFG